MGLQQFERRLERMVEGAFARAFRGGLQPVEIGRRLTREMDLRRTMAPKGTITPNEFLVVLSPTDRARFASIEDELVEELEAVARDHAEIERYNFVGPVRVAVDTDDQLKPGMVSISGEMKRPPARAPEANRPPAGGGPPAGGPAAPGVPGSVVADRPAAAPRPVAANLVMPDGRVRALGAQKVTIGRLPDCAIVLSDPNVSRYHAEIRPADALAAPAGEYEVADLGSTNGTKVNGVPLTEARVLRPGDRITLGATTIGFERG